MDMEQGEGFGNGGYGIKAFQKKVIVGINTCEWETQDIQMMEKQVFQVRGGLETSKVVMENLFGRSDWVKSWRISMSLVGSGEFKILYL